MDDANYLSFIELQVYTKELETIKSLWFPPSLTIQRFHRLSILFEEKIPELFLRPVNYQGFARAFNEEAKDLEAWQQAYKSGIEHIFQRNAQITQAWNHIRYSSFKIFNPSNNGYVDLRTPNPLCHDYIVIDYDGALYPSDEARWFKGGVARP